MGCIDLDLHMIYYRYRAFFTYKYCIPNYYYFAHFNVFHTSIYWWFSTEALCDGNSSQVSRTLISILVALNNAVILMVSTRPLISKSSSPFINPLVTVPGAPITNGITIIFMFHFFSFFCKVSKETDFSLICLIVLVGRVFANGPGDLGSIPGRVILKTLKMVLDTSLLNTQQYKVRIKGKVE